jgi:hypothetical protein
MLRDFGLYDNVKTNICNDYDGKEDLNFHILICGDNVLEQKDFTFLDREADYLQLIRLPSVPRGQRQDSRTILKYYYTLLPRYAQQALYEV